MNIYGFIKEASVTDYIDADALYQVLKDCPVTSHLELVECYDDMTIKMKGDMGFQFFKVVKGPEGFEAYKIAENSGEKLGDVFPLTTDFEEYDKLPDSTKIDGELKVGDKFTNQYGTIIEITDPTNAGAPQYYITPKTGTRDCRGTSNYDSLRRILQVNGYERFTETEEPETYEAVEEEIEKIRKQLDYCERRDAVCATFGADKERAELEARLIELSEKLDTWDGEKFVSERSLKEDEYKYTFTDNYYIINADDFEELVKANRGVFDRGYVVISKDEFTKIAKSKGFFDDQDIKLDEATLKEESYDEGIYTEIEDALYNAGFSVDRYSNMGMLTKNLGWVVSNSNGEVQLQCMGTYLDESTETLSKLTSVIDNFKAEENLNAEKFTEALNEISKLEWNNEISKEEYEEGIAKIKDIYKDRNKKDAEDDAIDYLTEAANPENEDANKLIKLALKDAKFAYDHKDELKELGIDVEYKVWSDRVEEPSKADDFVRCYLVGKNGRKLACNTSHWETGSMPTARDLNRTSDNYYDCVGEDTFAKKSYKDSREQVKNAKAELPTLKKRLKLYERRYGKDSSQYRELVRYIEQTERIIDRGIKAHKQTDYRQTPDENVDYKNYLDSKKIKDREKPYEAPKMNPTVAAYKGAKADEAYEAREEERNKKYDEEDAQRIADMAKRAAEEKSRRDAYLAKSKERTQATLKEIRDRIAASKAKRGAE